MKLFKHVMKREVRLLVTLALMEIIRRLMGASKAVAVDINFALILVLIVAIISVIEFLIKERKAGKEMSE